MITYALLSINFIFEFLSKIKSKALQAALKQHFPAVVVKQPVDFVRIKKTTIGQGTSIGEHCFFRAGAGVDATITLGENCQIANNCIFTTTNHVIKLGQLYANNVTDQRIVLGNNVWLGSGVIILPGVSLGDNIVVAAGAVVTKPFPQTNVVIGGVPAKVLRLIK